MSSGVSGRRRFLGTVSKTVAGGLLGGLIIGGAAGSLGTYLSLGTSRSTVTTTVVQSKKIKAGYIYIGPAKDFGWSYSHDQGRQWADKQMRGLVESYYVEGVLDPDAKGAMKSLLESRGVDLVVGTSFGYMDPMAELASEFPDRYFVHINGFRAGVLGNAPENMSVADINTYQIFYLEGLAAGSVTETGSVGVVATFPVPVINRLVNAFILGARYAYKRRTGREIKARIVWLNTWFDPVKARDATVSLIELAGADVVSSVEDSPTALQVAEEYTNKGRRVWGFSHYTDMRSFGPNSHLTGHIVNWGTVYLEFYKMVYTGTWRSVDIWARLGDFLPSRWAKKPEESTLGREEGAVYMAPLSGRVPDEWQLHIKARYEEMKEGLFEPFSSDGNLGEPIRDLNGEVRIDVGRRADRTALMNMDWIVEYASEI